MPTTYTALEDGSVAIFNSLGDARIGRWCRPPQVPDRCNCYAPDGSNLIADGYYLDTEGWRTGLCPRCYRYYLPGNWLEGCAIEICLPIPVED